MAASRAALGAPATNEMALVHRIRSLVNAAGLDDSAAHWLIKALHPPSATVGAVKIPDTQFRPSVAVDIREQATLSCPTLTAYALGWDLCVLSLPGDAIHSLWCIGPPGTDFTQVIGDGVPPFSVNGIIQTAGPGQYADYRVQTISANGEDGLKPYKAYANPAEIMEWRITNKSLTAYMTASSLNDGGTVTAYQINRNFEFASYASIPYQEGIPGDGYLAATALCNVPLDENMAALQVPGCYVRPARDGAYLPLRLLGPSQPFNLRPFGVGMPVFYPYSPPPVPASAARGPPTAPVGDQGIGMLRPWTFDLENSEYRYSPLTLPTMPVIGSKTVILPGSTPIGYQPVAWIDEMYRKNITNETGGKDPHLLSRCVDASFDRVATGVMIFRGLAPEATITLRCHLGLEAIPLPGSPYVAFTSPGIAPSPRALELYYELAAGMPMAYMARDNGFGDLLRKIWEGLKAVIVPAATTLGTVFGGPAVGAAAGLAAKGVVTLGDEIQHEVDKKKSVKGPPATAPTTRPKAIPKKKKAK